MNAAVMQIHPKTVHERNDTRFRCAIGRAARELPKAGDGSERYQASTTLSSHHGYEGDQRVCNTDHVGLEQLAGGVGHAGIDVPGNIDPRACHGGVDAVRPVQVRRDRLVHCLTIGNIGRKYSHLRTGLFGHRRDWGERFFSARHQAKASAGSRPEPHQCSPNAAAGTRNECLLGWKTRGTLIVPSCWFPHENSNVEKSLLTQVTAAL